jgi:hypothetical protein
MERYSADDTGVFVVESQFYGAMFDYNLGPQCGRGVTTTE